ncbi:unnamed protein product, partial [Phaeothamnion confervicola]
GSGGAAGGSNAAAAAAVLRERRQAAAALCGAAGRLKATAATMAADAAGLVAEAGAARDTLLRVESQADSVEQEAAAAEALVAAALAGCQGNGDSVGCGGGGGGGSGGSGCWGGVIHGCRSDTPNADSAGSAGGGGGDPAALLRQLEEAGSANRAAHAALSRAAEGRRRKLAALRSRLGDAPWHAALRRGGSGSSSGNRGSGSGNSGCGISGSGDGSSGTAKASGHRGPLFDLVHVAKGNPAAAAEAARCRDALAAILGGHLVVWICETAAEAGAALDAARAAGAAIRVWPREHLAAAASSESGATGQWAAVRRQRLAEARHVAGNTDAAVMAASFLAPSVLPSAAAVAPGSDSVMDPASLLEWDEADPAVDAAARRVLGDVFITADDATSAALLSCSGVRSVTRTGRRHSPGELVSSASAAAGRAAAAWLEYGALVAAAEHDCGHSEALV